MSNLQKIEIRKIVPVVAKISAGKSKLLNSLYNINFLECKSGIGTKFVNILRYNPNIEQSCFYHLKLKKEGDDYVFYKDLDTEIKGEENIIKENKNINNKLYQEKNINYEDIFYMTEINNSPFIKDKSYLENNDLCDIPGLSEYQDNKVYEKNESEKQKDENINEIDDLEENKKQAEEIGLVCDLKKEYKKLNENYIYPDEIEKKEEELDLEDDIYYEEVENNKNGTYLSEIFKIIKKYIDGAIIILSVENYKSFDNYQIIAQLKKVIQKPINNFLIILNKIDLSSNPNKDINECKGLFARYFPKFKTFNINLNFFVPLSVNRLKAELSMNKNFKDLIYCHFYNFLAKSDKCKKEDNNTNNISFITHLKNIIKIDKKIKKNEIESQVNNLNKSNDINIINKEIESMINDIQNEFKDKEINIGMSGKNIYNNDNDSESDDENDNDNDNESIDNLSPSYVIKYFYICHKERKKNLIPPISEETNKLLDYFKTGYLRRKSIFTPKEEIEFKRKDELNEKLITILEQLKNNILIKGKNEIGKITSLISQISTIIDFFKYFNVIFIPFLGEINSGKSTIINGIIGEDILPTGLEECTKRGIIIGYSNKNEEEIDIRKANFKHRNISNDIRYYFQPEKEIIGKGLDQVKEVLRDLNYNFNENEENSFYYIRTRIKLFDELGLDDYLKKMIYLIDLPGFGTKNVFENSIYLKLMSICNSFVFITKNSVIKENNQKSILDKIFGLAKEQKKLIASSFIESCLFIFNNFESQKTTEDDINRGKDDIEQIIPGIDKQKINLCFFNAKRYSIYFNNYNYFYNLKDTFYKEYKNYIMYNSNIFKDPENNNKNKKYSSFCYYIDEKLGQKNKTLFNSKCDKNQIVNIKVENDLTEIFKDLCIDMNDIFKYKNKICQKISYGQDKIKDFELPKESNIDGLKNNFLKQINKCNDNIQNLLKEETNKLLEKFDLFFSAFFSNYNKEKEKEEEKINENRKNIIEKINSLFVDSQNKYFAIIETYQNNIKTSLEEKKDNIKVYLSQKNYKKIIEEIIIEIKNSLKELNNKVIEFLNDINFNISEINKQIRNDINIFSSGEMKYNYLNFTEYFSNKIGTKNINLIEDIFNEIKIASLNLRNIFEEKGFRKWISCAFSKTHLIKNTIEIIINTFVNKMNYILILLTENLSKYFEKMFHTLDITYDLVSTKYTEQQIQIWKELSFGYEEKKLEIKKII